MPTFKILEVDKWPQQVRVTVSVTSADGEPEVKRSYTFFRPEELSIDAIINRVKMELDAEAELQSRAAAIEAAIGQVIEVAPAAS